MVRGGVGIHNFEQGQKDEKEGRSPLQMSDYMDKIVHV